MHSKKNIKIIVTLGKNGWLKVNDLIKNGANILRINGSHIKSFNDLSNILNKINAKLKNINNIEIMYDTRGPEIRTILINNYNSDEIYYEIKKNDTIIVHTNLSDKEIIFKHNKKNKQNAIHIGVNYKNFINDVEINDIITIDNRMLYAKIINKNTKNKTIGLKIISINTENKKYNLTNKRHINLLGKKVSQPTLTESDKQYIEKSVLSGVKYYAISFVRNKKDIIDVKNIIISALKKKYNTNKITKKIIEDMKSIKIIAKIETKQGLKNINSIVKEASGAMVARGDLSSEIPEEEVPYAKEKIIKTCNRYKKFSILATNVLEGFIKKKSPYINDIDTIVSTMKMGVNAIMLSNETAVSKQWKNAVKELKKHIDFFIKKNN